ncbi:MAG: SpoIVB peptidase, partial [Firmicutes bacterium]|nr:SpoIVB peptidase [Bacillota bacterium]
MNRERRMIVKKILWLFLCVLILGSIVVLPAASERHYFVAKGETLSLPGASVVEHEVNGVGTKEDAEGNLRFWDAGEYTVDPKLFGVVPLKDVAVSVYEEREVVPGGQSVGLIMKTRGVVVVGYSAVTDDRGKTVYPAKDGGVALGDCLLSVDGVAVEKDDDVADIIHENGGDGKVELELSRGGERTVRTVRTYYCEETKGYRIGLYVRDNTGGVGTMTFYDPATGRFGALGHAVPEAEEQENGLSGRILPAAISGINAAGNGRTGEKIGYFDPGAFDGDIDHI